MATYACTMCMHWFRFDQLSEDKQLCGTCLLSADDRGKKKSGANGGLKRRNPSRVYRLQCKCCLTAIKVKDSKQSACDRCAKNIKEFGKPKKCQFCQLDAAFIGNKCQRCSSGLKKFGRPLTCSKCGLKSAFDNAKARFDGQLLCWVCCMNYHRETKKTGAENNNEDVIFEETVVYEDLGDTNDQQMMDVVLDKPQHQQPVVASSLDDRIKNLQQRINKGDSPSSKKSSRHPSQQRINKGDSPSFKKSSQYHSQQRINKGDSPSFKKSSQYQSQHPTRHESRDGEPPHKRRTPNVDKLNSSTPGSNTSIGGSHFKSMDRFRTTPLPDKSVTLPAINDGNIVVVTKLREEIAALKKVIGRKDNELLEKDKQISLLKVEHLQQTKTIQTKLKNQEDEYLRKMENLCSKNRDLIRKNAQASKGK